MNNTPLAQPTHKTPTASLVLGVLSLTFMITAIFLFFLLQISVPAAILAGICAVLGTIFGITTLIRKDTPRTQRATGITGLVLSLITLTIFALILSQLKW